MGKRKKPVSKRSGSEAEVELLPPARLPAPDVGARPLFQALQVIRAAVGAMLDLADAAAAAVTKGLRRVD